MTRGQQVVRPHAGQGAPVAAHRAPHGAQDQGIAVPRSTHLASSRLTASIRITGRRRSVERHPHALGLRVLLQGVSRPGRGRSPTASRPRTARPSRSGCRCSPTRSRPALRGRSGAPCPRPASTRRPPARRWSGWPDRIASSTPSNSSMATTGPKISSLGDPHADVDVVEHGRLDEVARAVHGGRLAAGPQRRALLAARLDVGEHLVALLGLETRAPRRVLGSVGIAGHRLRRALAASFSMKASLHRALHVQPGAGRADLAFAVEDPGRRAPRRRVQVRVREHDVGRLPAQLERDVLHGRRPPRHDCSRSPPSR